MNWFLPLICPHLMKEQTPDTDHSHTQGNKCYGQDKYRSLGDHTGAQPSFLGSQDKFLEKVISRRERVKVKGQVHGEEEGKKEESVPGLGN